MALVEVMSRDNVDGSEFTDHYTQALREVVEAKQQHRRLPQAPHPAARPNQLVDLMAALQQSVNTAQAARGDNSADAPDPPTAATKTTARKAAKKSPARKASPRRHRHSVQGCQTPPASRRAVRRGRVARLSAAAESWFWITFSAGATEGHHNRDHERPHA
ncbi:hypothetical protein ACFRNR_43185, partial [Streptomyces sp. NPDC056820]